MVKKATGLFRAQITRLVRQHRRTGGLGDYRKKPPATPFPHRCTPRDIALLAEGVDEAFGQLSGPATSNILRHMYEVHGEERFERLASVSNGHIYNLRRSRSCRFGHITFRETCSTPASIGKRRKPTPDGKPGFLRVDTVHLGDWKGKKESHVINVIDEVPGFCTAAQSATSPGNSSSPSLRPVPFTINAFHADNGSEYINHRIAELLDKLYIGESIKSRPHKSNDNALVESQNGSILRR